jgi:tetratricopeptide (TPR) repeat protein
MGSSESPSQNRPGVEYLLAQVISILNLETPSQQQLEQALALSGEIISRARETHEWFRTEVFGRVNAATALLDLGQPLEAKDEVLLALQKASGFSLSAEDRIKALALLGACEKALNNRDAAKAAFDGAIRFADRVVAGNKLPGAHKLPRGQVLAIKQGWGPAYVEVVSSVQRLRQVVEDELKALASGFVSLPLDAGASLEAMSSVSETSGSPAEAPTPRPLSSIRPDLARLVEDQHERLYAATEPRTLEQIVSDSRRVLDVLRDLNENDVALTIPAHRNIGLASMRQGKLEQAKAELLESERLAAPVAIDLRTRYLNWNALTRVFLLLREDDSASRTLSVGLAVARGLLGRKLVRPRGPGLDIPHQQWDILRRQASDECRALVRFIKAQQHELRQLRKAVRVPRLHEGTEVSKQRIATAEEVKKRLPSRVLKEWPRSPEGDALVEWLHEHGYHTLDPTLIDLYYPHISSLNDFLANVVLNAFLPMVREDDRRAMAIHFESRSRPYSLIGLIETDVENDQQVTLNDEDSKTIAELTASVRAVPHATLPGEIQTVLKTSSNRALNP